MSELLQGRTGADAHNLIANNRKAGRAWFLATDAALRMLGTNPEHATGKVCGALGM
jgi:topoisomerase IA-like protein